jgi:pimeloyl-ACP methyl ester carboxylesterase
MRGGRSRRIAALACVLGFACAAGSSTASADLLSRCNHSDRTLCGRVTVPLDRSGAVPGTVSLLVRVLPPKHGAPAGTVLALAGGPGQAATPLVDDIATGLGSARDSRQLVTFDQRGTGGSGRLSCHALASARTQAAAVSGCASQLGPARADNTTAASVEDLEAVRAALGVERLTLLGTSYGTKVALAYAAAYPQHVDRLVLDSVVLPTGIDPFARTTVASVPRVLRTLCAGSCRFTHDPARDVAGLVRKLAARPLRGTALDAHGHRQHVSVTRADVLGMLVGGDIDPELRAAFPAAVHAALHGDAAPLLRLDGSGSAGGDNRSVSEALYLATSCEDGGVAWPAGTPVEQRRAAVDAAARALPNAAFAPFDRATVRAFGTADLCRAWPESPIVQQQLPLPASPTLILSGDDDLRTPRTDATTLAHQLSAATVLQVPDAGHSVLESDPTDCAQKAVAAFLDGAIPGGCRPHARALATLPLPPRSMRALRALRGTDARTGRTVGAVVLTLGDVVDQVIEQSGSVRAFGGLRAGSASVDPGHGVRLRGYSYVPGVTVTGIVPTKSSAFTLRVGGPAAARGRLKLSAKTLTGTLGGKRVKIGAKELVRKPLAAAVAAALAPHRKARLALVSAGGLRGGVGR